ncbi:MAG: DUF1080 domain-containing protein [Planctomycetia bacterium]|nr:DUF1080 domain-containing protein [Planctomycetia bacterium]
MRRWFVLSVACALVLGAALPAQKKTKEVWTDATDETLPVDFKFQGEYAADKIGAQVIALGDGAFQAVVLEGGLPGAGWDGKNKSLLHGKLDGDKVVFTAITAAEKRNYLNNAADKFSATSKFPPPGHKELTGTISGTPPVLTLGNGTLPTLKKVTRESKTLGAKPPEGAIVLFDGSNKDAWTGGRLDANSKLLNTDGADIRTKQKFSNYTMHVEFLLPYRPKARGQGRGNSGFYQVDMYEVQILDSFGLDGKNNECGGVYTKLDPSVNMCLPPLVWQTYDIEFTNAVADGGKKVKNARLTLRHNGVLVHDDKEINGKTGGARGDAEGTPGPIQLQGHGNPLQFRNVWIVEKK